MGLEKDLFSHTHGMPCTNTTANSNSEAVCIQNAEPSVF